MSIHHPRKWAKSTHSTLGEILRSKGEIILRKLRAAAATLHDKQNWLWEVKRHDLRSILLIYKKTSAYGIRITFRMKLKLVSSKWTSKHKNSHFHASGYFTIVMYRSNLVCLTQKYNKQTLFCCWLFKCYERGLREKSSFWYFTEKKQ